MTYTFPPRNIDLRSLLRQLLMENAFNLLPAIVLVLISTILIKRRTNKKEIKTTTYDVDPLLGIKPVTEDFNWATEDPFNVYPFKDKAYKLTMSVRNMVAQDWLLIENTYLKRIEEKTKLVTNTHLEYPEGKDTELCTVFPCKDAEPAIREFYDVAVKYMCDKYPMYFSVSEGTVHNLITGEDIPLRGGDLPLRQLMQYLVRTIEEDFIIMMPDPTKENEPHGTEYFFKGGVFAFANGFNPADKIGKPLSAIHVPVPGYEEKLKLSMNKFFARLKVGEFVGRSNFSIQNHALLYDDSSNKGYHFDPAKPNTLDFDKVDFTSEMNYRSERQVLTRLPKTQAVIFTIRTYLHPFSEFEGEVPKRLLGALNGLPKDMATYKNEPYWGKAVKRYLDEL